MAGAPSHYLTDTIDVSWINGRGLSVFDGNWGKGPGDRNNNNTQDGRQNERVRGERGERERKK